MSTFQSEFPVMQSDGVGFEEKGEGATVREAICRHPEGIEVDSRVEEALSKLRQNSERPGQS